MDYSRFLTATSAARKRDAIREFNEILTSSTAPVISLAEGMPNPISFPFKDAEFRLKDGSTLAINEQLMEDCNQYGPTRGYPPLISWLGEFMSEVFHPPTAKVPSEEGGFTFCMTAGAMAAISKAADMLINRGDLVVIEKYSYCGTLSCIRPIGCRFLEVETDDHGMIPESLSKVLSPWKPEDAQNPYSDVPKVLYIVPTGGNPTGVSLTLERKKAIYKIAQKYNMLILEDDPYYFLDFENEDGFPLTFLGLDEDGRVLRFDTFSKVLSAGLRLGFVSGPEALIRRIIYHNEVDMEHCSSLSQILVYKLLEKWGSDGFLKHTKMCTAFYKQQRDDMMAAASKYLSDKAEWHCPNAGLYMWIRVKGFSDTKDLMMKKALEKGILMLPGRPFMPDMDTPCPYIRACFSFITKDQMEVACQQLAVILSEGEK